MINQVTNLIQFKNLSKEQQASFDFENYEYEGQDSGHGSENTKFTKILPCGKTKGMAHRVYRLKIEPEKWYFSKYLGNPHIILGKEVTYQAEEHYMPILRPATPDEQPKPLSLEDRIKAEFSDKRVVMLEFGREGNDNIDLLKMMEDQFMYPCESGGYHSTHTEAQSMKGFYRYVYICQSEIDDGEIKFYTSREPTEDYDILDGGKTIHPVATLFSVQS